MRNSKSKSKRNLAVPGEPMSQEEFVALIKEAEKGPFTPLDSLVEDVALRWEKKSKVKGPSVGRISAELLTDYNSQIKKAEKGPFYSHSELLDKLTAWKSSLKK